MIRRMQSLSSLLLMAVGLLVLAGCIQPTTYRQAVDGYGYGERQLGPNRYEVVFAGNPRTSRETVHQYVLFRAAQLADKEGYQFVGINDSDQQIERFGDLFARPTTRLDLGQEDGGGPAGRGITKNNDGQVRASVERYQATLDVSFYETRGSVPLQTREVYEIDKVLQELGPAIDVGSS